MKAPLIAVAAALALGAGLLLAARPPQDAAADPMAQAFADAAKYLQPQPEHAWLEQFLGEWDTTMRVTMMPGQPPMESKGKASARWLLEGRWLLLESEGSMMGMPLKTATILGYDAFKKKFVSSMCNSFDPFLLQAEGMRDRSGQVLHLWGPMDEYLTGERDKPVRYTWRLPSADLRVLEVHDLAIGETDTKVVEVEYARRK
jgi:hypothetical protein